MLLIEEIATFLDAQGVVNYDPSGTSGNTFLNALPTEPDACVAIYQHGGTDADPKNEYRQPSIQFMVRSVPHDPRKAIPWGQEIIDALNGFHADRLTSGGRYIVDATASQSAPQSIGQDGNQRHEFSFNFLIEFTI